MLATICWERLQIDRSNLKVDEAVLPRKRKCTQRYDDGTSAGDYSDTPKLWYRQQYFEALDLIINSIKSRFEQEGYNTYKNLQELLLNAIKGSDLTSELEFVSKLYGNDIDKNQLKCQLQIFALDYNDKRLSLNIS